MAAPIDSPQGASAIELLHAELVSLCYRDYIGDARGARKRMLRETNRVGRAEFSAMEGFIGGAEMATASELDAACCSGPVPVVATDDSTAYHR